MSLILVGLNHRTAPVNVRERMSVPENDVPNVVEQLRALSGVRGASIISTCNRVETIVSAESEDVIEPVVDALTLRSGIERAEIEKHLYILRNNEAVRHLFRVASGLDSMIVGEPQIGGQVRQSYQISKSIEALDPVLQKLYEHTLAVAKKVRTETGIGENAVSIPFAAVELARKIFGELKGLNALLVGAGKIGELTAQHLHGFGLGNVFVANRNFEKAQILAERFEGEAIPFEKFEERLAQTDIVVVSTAAPTYTVNAAQVEKAIESRRRKNLFLIDLSVPRNIDPEIANVDGAYLYNIDDLQEVADSNRQKRLERADLAEVIISKEVTGFQARMAHQEVVPTIVELQKHLEEIRLAELEKALRRVGPITPEQREAIEVLSMSIVNKVLHYPILRLKESASADAHHDGASVRETIRRIFGLR